MKTSNTIKSNGRFCVKRAKNIFGLALFCAFMASVLSAEVPTAEFLRINPSAASSALGGSYVGYAGKIDSIYSNPGGLYLLKSQQLSATWVEYVQDVNLASFAYAQPFGKNVIGVSVLYLGMPGMPVYTSSFARDPNRATASISNYAIGATYSRDVCGVGLGVTVKGIHQSYDEVASNGVAADAGASYKLGNFNMGVSALNFGPEMDGQKLPSSVSAGAVFNCPKHPLDITAAVEKPVYTNFNAKAGVEYEVLNKVTVRGGYEYQKDATSASGISGGAGFKTSITDGFLGEKSREIGISLDYAFTYFGELGNVHKISLGCEF